jgi:hypothetical protein
MNTQTTYRRLIVPSDVKNLLNQYKLSIDSILTSAAGNAKLNKNKNFNIIPPAVILHLLPDKQINSVSNKNNNNKTLSRAYIPELDELIKKHNLRNKVMFYSGCAFSTSGCAENCLNFSGRNNVYKTVNAARGRRTLAGIDKPNIFVKSLVYSIAKHYKKNNFNLAVRLKGTDENHYHFKKTLLTVPEINNLNAYFNLNILYDNKPRTLTEIFKNDSINFYEYSKGHIKYLNALKKLNIDVTASMAADRLTGCNDAITAHMAGYRLAVPVALNSKVMPDNIELRDNTGRRVIMPAVNFDLFDYRILNKNNVAGILKVKRPAAGNIKSDFFIKDIQNKFPKIGGGEIKLIYK